MTGVQDMKKYLVRREAVHSVPRQEVGRGKVCAEDLERTSEAAGACHSCDNQPGRLHHLPQIEGRKEGTVPCMAVDHREVRSSYYELQWGGEEDRSYVVHDEQPQIRH
jgi:hypothetical protein